MSSDPGRELALRCAQTRVQVADSRHLMARARERTQAQAHYARSVAARAEAQADRHANGWSAAHGLPSHRGRRADADVLGGIVEAAAYLVASCDSVSATTVDQLGEHRPSWRTAAATGGAATVDEAQYELGEGPCLDAVELDMLAAVSADDLAGSEARRIWPRLVPVAADLGVRSALSVGLPWTAMRVGVHPERQPLGALNFYAAAPHAFDRCRQHRATLLACWAAALMSGREPAEIRRVSG
ncbi:hypothetical protein [Actinomycetospora sp. TBRC 11914]|uniref:hypothetical protein n=1 Tax=Actinomycetospora sp. TBRC 11914 TaxID=2729387 RepID=UPI00145F2AA1|nr:hypothetical protein [Actinomycetospora sp. TBRC 11914]NMO94079.1 hypothetical protein [Actinomycetospora sp. TBRC 11914]